MLRINIKAKVICRLSNQCVPLQKKDMNKVDNIPNLNAILKNKGITKKDLADMLGISAAALHSYINGNPTIESIQKIADALQIPLVDLFLLTSRNDKRKDRSEISCPCCGRKLTIDVNLNIK